MNLTGQVAAPFAVRQVVAFETVETKPMVCNLGCKHDRAKVMRRYNLAVVETRDVPSLWARAYGHEQTGTGLRAIDQFGDEWLSDWDGEHSDGPSHFWTTQDGRRAEGGVGPYPDYDQPRAYDGVVVLNTEG